MTSVEMEVRVCLRNADKSDPHRQYAQATLAFPLGEGRYRVVRLEEDHANLATKDKRKVLSAMDELVARLVRKAYQQGLSDASA